MKKVIQTLGGVVIAAAAVILAVGLLAGVVIPKLGEKAGLEGRGERQAGAALEAAVLSDPILNWRGESHIKAGEDYAVWEKIFVQDSYNGYKKSLKEAVREGKIRVQKMQVLDREGKESAYASADSSAGIIRVEKSGVYQVSVRGMDQHNNEVREKFLIAVNRRGEEN